MMSVRFHANGVPGKGQSPMKKGKSVFSLVLACAGIARFCNKSQKVENIHNIALFTLSNHKAFCIPCSVHLTLCSDVGAYQWLQPTVAHIFIRPSHGFAILRKALT